MKKIALCALPLFLLATTAFAEKSSIHSLQIAVPIENNLLIDQDMQQAQFAGVNLNYSKMTTNINKYVGYSGIFEIGLGYNYGIIKDFEIKKENIKHLDDYQVLKEEKKDLEYMGMDLLNIKWGWGVAYTPTERIILASHLFLGGDVKIMMTPGVEAPSPVGSGRFGQDFSFSYKIKDRFGITTQLDTYFLAGGGGCSYNYTYYNTLYTPTQEKEESEHSGSSIIGFGTDIKFGLCWVF